MLNKKIINFLLESINDDDDDFEIDKEELGKYRSETSLVGKSKFLKLKKNKKRYYRSGLFTKEFQEALKDASEKSDENVQRTQRQMSVEEFELRKKDLAKDVSKAQMEIENNKLFYYIAWLKGNFFWKNLYMQYLDACVKNSQTYEENEKFKKNKRSLSDMDDDEENPTGKPVDWTLIDYMDYAVPKRTELSVKEWHSFQNSFVKELISLLYKDVSQADYDRMLNFTNPKTSHDSFKQKTFLQWCRKDESDVESEYLEKNKDKTTMDFKFEQANKLLADMSGIDTLTGEFSSENISSDDIDEIKDAFVNNPYDQVEFEIKQEEKRQSDFENEANNYNELMSSNNRESNNEDDKFSYDDQVLFKKQKMDSNFEDLSFNIKNDNLSIDEKIKNFNKNKERELEKLISNINYPPNLEDESKEEFLNNRINAFEKRKQIEYQKLINSNRDINVRIEEFNKRKDIELQKIIDDLNDTFANESAEFKEKIIADEVKNFEKEKKMQFDSLFSSKTISDEENMKMRAEDFAQSNEMLNKIKNKNTPNFYISDSEKLVEYISAFNELDKMINSDQFLPKNLDKYALEFEDRNNNEFEEIDDIQDENNEKISSREIVNNILSRKDNPKNIDRLEDIFYMYALLKADITMISEKLELSKQKNSQYKYGDITKKIDAALRNVVAQVYKHINSIQSLNPIATNKLAIVARNIDQYRNQLNNSKQSKFWTLPAMVTAAGGLYAIDTSGTKTVASSGLQRSMTEMLMQATWAQSMLKQNKIAELRIVSMQAWLDDLDTNYNISLGYEQKVKEGVTLQEKLNQLMSQMNDEQKKQFKPKTPESVRKEYKKISIDNLNIDPLYTKLTDKYYEYEERIEDLIDEIDTMSGADSAGLTNIRELKFQLNYYTQKYEKTKQQMARIEYQFEQLAKIEYVTKREEKKKQMTDDILRQIQQIQDEIYDLDSWDKKIYSKSGTVKGVKQYDKIDFDTFINKDVTTDDTLSPDYILNQAKIADYNPKNKKLEINKNMKSAIEKYYNYPDTSKQSELGETLKDMYLDSMKKSFVGKDIDVFYIEKLMTDNKSPFSNYHRILISRFFVSDRTESYNRFVNDAIIDYLNQNYGQINPLRNKSDELLVRYIKEYAFGYSNSDYDYSLRRTYIKQNQKQFVRDLEKYWTEKGFCDTLSKSTIYGFYEHSSTRKKFWSDLVKSATTFSSKKNTGERKPGGQIADAVLKNMYDPNITQKYEEFVNSLSKSIRQTVFNQSLNATEFYSKFDIKDTHTIVEPDSYFKANEELKK
jgi:hypothetical protein